jgi:sugar O-acyltransferase (sialic acid O-acetyltransferase NeuD family)
MEKSIILIGGFSEVIELCELESIKILGIVDNQKKGTYMGYQIFGTDEIAQDLFNSFRNIPVFITPDSPEKRIHLSKLYGDLGFDFFSLISSNSIISKSAEIGKGVFIQSKVNISAFAKIGNFCRVNTMANIMHNCTIGEDSIIAPNAVILGDVHIGNNCYIGANSTILPHKRIGNNVTIGAGAVVTKDVPDGKTMLGNPAKELIVS